MDESYMAMREEAAAYFNNRFRSIFDEAFGDIESDIILMFNHEYATAEKNGVLNIYTNHPGILIGVAGKNVDKLKDALRREFGHDYYVHFHEVRHYYSVKQFKINDIG